jgi:hypothetical protein
MVGGGKTMLEMIHCRPMTMACDMPTVITVGESGASRLYSCVIVRKIVKPRLVGTHQHVQATRLSIGSPWHETSNYMVVHLINLLSTGLTLP